MNDDDKIQIILDYIEQLGCLNYSFIGQLVEEFKNRFPEGKRKILYSPGYGAGWSSWESAQKIKKYMLEYKPIIEFLENGGTITPNHTIIKQFEEDCKKKFDYVPYTGGAYQLTVVEVSGPVKIDEYDGFESYEELGYDDDFL